VSAPKGYRGREVNCLACKEMVQVPLNAEVVKDKKKIGLLKLILAIVGGIIVIQFLLGIIAGLWSGV